MVIAVMTVVIFGEEGFLQVTVVSVMVYTFKQWQEKEGPFCDREMWSFLLTVRTHFIRTRPSNFWINYKENLKAFLLDYTENKANLNVDYFPIFELVIVSFSLSNFSLHISISKNLWLCGYNVWKRKQWKKVKALC